MTQENSRVTVFGAGGATGRMVVERAVERQLQVKAVEHSWPANAVDAPRVSHHTADVIDDDLTALIRHTDFVISTIGLGFSPGTVLNPPPLYTAGTLNILKAMDRAGVHRLIVISAAFVDPEFSAPIWFKATAEKALRQVYNQMANMERILEASPHIQWTAVRPGWLLDKPQSDDYEIFPSRLPDHILRTRHADLADFMLRCGTDRCFAKAKPAIGRREHMKFENPFALIREFV